MNTKQTWTKLMSLMEKKITIIIIIRTKQKIACLCRLGVNAPSLSLYFYSQSICPKKLERKEINEEKLLSLSIYSTIKKVRNLEVSTKIMNGM